MNLSEGMMAIVHGLPNGAGLGVSLLERSKTYTPNTGEDRRNRTVSHPKVLKQAISGQHSPAHRTQRSTAAQSASTDVCQELRDHGAHCHSGAQAVDGRYASVYQMSHCHVHPTSPPVESTEFPPQRSELCPGRGNFVVGGLGSGESTYSPAKIAASYRGGLNWPDRGAVFSPRPSRDSREPDAFANSLRKYPNTSPERSSELVERLIHVTQMKNAGSPAKVSPSHPETSSNQGYDRTGCITATLRSPRGYEPEIADRTKFHDESPTRDADGKLDYDAAEMKRAVFGKHYDVGCLRDAPRRAKETEQNINYATNSVHMETQAEIPMVSIQVATLPREQPSTRNVAVSLSPSSFFSDTQKRDSEPEIKFTFSCKSIQTLEPVGFNLQIRKSVQTCLSSIDIPRKSKRKVKTSRKSRSQEEIKITDELEEELLQLIKDLSMRPELDTELGIRNGLLGKLRKIHSLDTSDRVKMTFGRCIRNHLYSQIDFKNFTRELSNELISKIKRRNIFASSYNNPKKIFRAEVCPFRSSYEESYVDELVKEWLEDIPIKSLDYLGREVKKEQVLQTVTDKIKHLVMNKVQQDCYSLLKPEIFDIIEDIPIEINARHKIYFLNKIVTNLVNKIGNLCSVNTTDRKKWKKTIDLDPSKNNLQQEAFDCKYNQPTEEELKQFVKKEMKKFTAKFNLNICPNTEKEIQVELIDILIDSMEAIRYGNDEQVKEEIMVLLSDLIVISQYEGIYFANNLICNFKNSFKESLSYNTIPKTLFVQQNTLQNASMQTQNNTNAISTAEITPKDLHNNLDTYTHLIIQQINEWMTNIQGLRGIDVGRKEVVAHDLAGDIVDRCKYLQLNPRCKGNDEDELENLKYQIFKSVNKLAGDDNLETIERASELMQRIQNISVPMLTKTSQNEPLIRHQCYITITGDPICDECCNGQTQTKNTIVVTEESLDNNDGIPKRNSYTETDMHIMNHPDGTSTNVMENLKETSTNTRFSDPANLASEPGSLEINLNSLATSKVSSTGKQITEQNRIHSSLGAIFDDPLRKYFSGQTQTENLNVMTDANLDKTDRISKRNLYTEPNIPSIPQLWGTSMNMMQNPKETSRNRRFSGPAESILGIIKPGTIPTPLTVAVAGTSYNSVNEWNTSTRYSSAGRTTTVYQSCVLATPTIKQLNEDYDKYLLDWVQQIPIQSSNDEEEALAQNMRQGIYNGVWKALTKLKMNPTNLNNPFYYQDVLEDELEELLSLLPENIELTKKKQVLKSQLIEKTTRMNEHIINTAASSSFKQQLVENVTNNFPRTHTDFSGSDIAKVCEEIHGINIAETFIMYTMYREEDKVKANVYKKKLMKHVQEFIDDLKQNLGKEITDIDIGSYRDQIINALYKVPLPNEETIREEADEILLGLEIEQWFSDLPLYPATDYLEILCRMRYRDSLAKKVHEMERQKNLADCEDELRSEIIKFMEKLPLRPGATENTRFMVEELVNRLKNRPKDILAGSGGRRKSVHFDNGHGYDEFSRDMQLCSSFSDEPNAKRAQINESSYLIVGGERAKDASYPYGGQYVQNRHSDTPQTEQQWFSMEECTIPSAMLSGPRQASARKTVQRQRLPKGPLHSSGQTIGPPQVSASSQTPIPALTIRETISDQPQTVPDFSFQKSFAQARMRRQSNITDPQTSRLPDAYISENLPGQETIPGGSPGFAASFPESSPRASRSPASMPGGTTEYGPEGSTRPYETGQGPSPRLEGMGQFGERSYTQTPSEFYREPVGFSTPQQNISGRIPIHQRESRPKKRTRELERERREAARRRIGLEDSDESDKEEVRCRCMERVWRCRKKRPQCFPCDDDFIMNCPPCCPMRFPYAYYF